MHNSFFLKNLFIYLFIYLFIGGGREKERERSIDVCRKHQSVASCTLPTGDSPPPQPRPVTRQGMEPATYWFTGQHLIHWATPGQEFFILDMSFTLVTNVMLGFWGCFFCHMEMLIIVRSYLSGLFFWYRGRCSNQLSHTGQGQT